MTREILSLKTCQMFFVFLAIFFGSSAKPVGRNRVRHRPSFKPTRTALLLQCGAWTLPLLWKTPTQASKTAELLSKAWTLSRGGGVSRSLACLIGRTLTGAVVHIGGG